MNHRISLRYLRKKLFNMAKIIHVDWQLWEAYGKYFRSCFHSWLITVFVARVTRWVPYVEQELITLPEHTSSLPDISGVYVAQSLVLCVMFCKSLFFLLYFYFGHCIVCPSIYDCWRGERKKNLGTSFPQLPVVRDQCSQHWLSSCSQFPYMSSNGELLTVIRRVSLLE